MKDHSIKKRIKWLLKVITPSLIGRVGVGLFPLIGSVGLFFPLVASAQITQKQMEQIYETAVPRYSVTTAGGL